MHLETNPAACFARPSRKSIPIYCLDHAQWAASNFEHPDEQRDWALANGFKANRGQFCTLPDAKGGIACVFAGLGDLKAGERTNAEIALSLGGLARSLPPKTFHFENEPGEDGIAALAWAMGAYSFSRYVEPSKQMPRLAVKSKDVPHSAVEAVYLARDLINIPANDMGPEALEKAFRSLAKHHMARASVVKGDALLTKNFPMVHAVGRASDEAPRVLDMRWGKTSHPKITLVGKGVTFDTGGLNIKPGGSMALMKKDMGGAANVIALAHMIMAAKLPVRLRLIVGAVENAISGNAFRPGDVLQSRKGLSVEIGNTDAEGRLVLGDCLALADEEKPDVLIDMATLTGAARVALGADLPPFYSHDDMFCDELADQANATFDPLWRMPLWPSYRKLLKSKIADINHISSGGMAGSITAALFLERFVENAKTWAHFDIYGWVPADKPWARTGGEAQGIRALFGTIKARYDR
ncbi:MAG: leucyl aminopeptidase family protein [Pseudomonadota bacterium]